MPSTSPALVLALGLTAVLAGRIGPDELHHEWRAEFGSRPQIAADHAFDSGAAQIGFTALIAQARRAGADGLRLAPPGPLGPLGLPRMERWARRIALDAELAVLERDRTALAVIAVAEEEVSVLPCAGIRFEPTAATPGEAQRALRQAVLDALGTAEARDLDHELRDWQRRQVTPEPGPLREELGAWIGSEQRRTLLEQALMLRPVADELLASPWRIALGTSGRALALAIADAQLSATRDVGC